MNVDIAACVVGVLLLVLSMSKRSKLFSRVVGCAVGVAALSLYSVTIINRSLPHDSEMPQSYVHCFGVEPDVHCAVSDKASVQAFLVMHGASHANRAQ